MVANTTANGESTRCAARECSVGLTAVCTVETSSMTRRKVKAYACGQMANSMMVDGRMGDNMEKALKQMLPMEVSGKENGKKVI